MVLSPESSRCLVVLRLLHYGCSRRGKLNLVPFILELKVDVLLMKARRNMIIHPQVADRCWLSEADAK